MKQTIAICDGCGAQLWPKTNPAVSVDVKIDKPRACAEDDTYYTETIDLCCLCAARQFKEWVTLYPKAGQNWATQMRERANARARANG